jgi:hypothetical protein
MKVFVAVALMVALAIAGLLWIARLLRQARATPRETPGLNVLGIRLVLSGSFDPTARDANRKSEDARDHVVQLWSGRGPSHSIHLTLLWSDCPTSPRSALLDLLDEPQWKRIDVAGHGIAYRSSDYWVAPDHVAFVEMLCATQNPEAFVVVRCIPLRHPKEEACPSS